MAADAFATACMVMGLNDAQALIDNEKGVEAFFIYADEAGGIKELETDGASSYIVK